MCMNKIILMYFLVAASGIGLGIYNHLHDQSQIVTAINQIENKNIEVTSLSQDTSHKKNTEEDQNSTLVISETLEREILKTITDRYNDYNNINQVLELDESINFQYEISEFNLLKNNYWGIFNVQSNSIPESLYFAGTVDDGNKKFCIQTDLNDEYKCMCEYMRSFSQELIQEEIVNTVCVIG